MTASPINIKQPISIMKPLMDLCLRNVSLSLTLAFLALPAICSAADVTLTAGDSFGASSFNSAGNWDNAAAPSAGNNYFNGGFLLRTPADTGDHTFAGDSLTITGSGLATGVNNEALMWKGSGTTAIITVDDLTIDGGQLRHGQGDGDTFTLAGNLTVGANGANFGTQGGMILTANVIGTTTIRVLDSGNTDARRLITFASSANTFTGNIELAGGAADRARFALADGANLNFVIGSSGVNNSISGTGTATFDGDFMFDLTGASTTVGDSWTIASAADQSFGSTFTVAGFASLPADKWLASANGAYYLFDEAAGALSVIVPEPSSVALLMVGVGMLLGFRRSRKA